MQIQRRREVSGFRQGFTLLEIVLTLGLITIMAGMVVFQLDGLLRSWSSPAPEQQLQAILREARLFARDNHAVTDLFYREDTRTFHAIDSRNGTTRDWPLRDVPPRFKVSVYTLDPFTQPVVPSQLRPGQPLSHLRFDADGLIGWTLMEWSDGGRRPLQRLIDPFTLDFSEI